MRTPLELVNYETVENLSMTVGEMLMLSSALFDATRWNEDKGYLATAKKLREFHYKLRDQFDDLIDEADRKVGEFLADHAKARESARETQETLDYLQRSEANG